MSVYAVSKNLPEYLRLHTEDSEQITSLPPETLGEFDAICGAFQQTTGQRLQYAPPNRAVTLPEIVWQQDIVSIGSTEPGQLALGPSHSFDVVTPKEAAGELAGEIGRLLNQVNQLRATLWKREAELATAIPVIASPAGDVHFAERLESIISGGAKAIGCTAAGLYLLDETTTHLKIRASWGLPHDVYLSEPRMLENSLADIEALTGHVVALEDTSTLPQWESPLPYGAALCVPVSSESIPLGTLWMFNDTPRDFSDDQTNIAEIIAGRLAADLEREVLLLEHMATRSATNSLHALGFTADENTIECLPVIDGWDLAASNGLATGEMGHYYMGQLLEDGKLGIALGGGLGSRWEASMEASIVRASVLSHCQYPHKPQELLTRTSDTLYASGAGDRFSSLFYAKFDTTSGQIDFAQAGQLSAFLVRSDQCLDIAREDVPLGTYPEHDYRHDCHNLLPGDAVVLVYQPQDELIDSLAASEIEAAVAANLSETADELVVRVHALLNDNEDQRPVVMVIKRG